MKFNHIYTNRDLLNILNSLSEEQLNMRPIICADEEKDRTIETIRIAEDDCLIDDEYYDEASTLKEGYDDNNIDDVQSWKEIIEDERNPVHRKGTVFFYVDDIPKEEIYRVGQNVFFKRAFSFTNDAEMGDEIEKGVIKIVKEVCQNGCKFSGTNDIVPFKYFRPL